MSMGSRMSMYVLFYAYADVFLVVVQWVFCMIIFRRPSIRIYRQKSIWTLCRHMCGTTESGSSIYALQDIFKFSLI